MKSAVEEYELQGYDLSLVLRTATGGDTTRCRPMGGDAYEAAARGAGRLRGAPPVRRAHAAAAHNAESN